MGIEGFGVWQMAQSAADQADMLALLQRILRRRAVVALLVMRWRSCSP
jgi:hypothetical protein